MKNAAAAGVDTTALAHQVGKKLAVHIGALVSLAIVTLALWVLYHTLHEIHLRDVIDSFNDLPAASILLAFLITALSYFAVTGYDVLALHHLQRPLPYWRTALASFLASAFGNNVGFTMLTGGSIRYRIYSQAGLSAIEIAGVTTMCSLTTVMGMVFIFAVSLLFASGEVSDTALQLPPGLRRYVGFSIMAVILGYLVVSALRPITFTTENWSLRLPTAKTALAQGGLATLDLLLVGTLIYTLLPTHAGTDFISFLGIFALAMMAGSMSNVPGGIGVFETVLLLGLPEIPPAALLGSVLLFRCVYYLSPLSLAAILFAAYELVLRRTRILRIHGAATDWLAEIGPQIMGVIIVFAGVVLLFSGAIPTYGERLRILRDSVPLGIVEIAQLVASAAGLGLIILARGISLRLSKAYGLSVLLLGLGIPAVLLKGLDYQEAVILATVLIVLLPTRAEFQRHASLFSQGFTVGWVSALTAILAITIWLGLFNFKHLAYSHELWWQFAYDADLPRFLRAMFVVFGITGGVMLFNLF
ncbi:MAG: lysylphosphatidylglycerol synthase domain-containing protein, partial [Gammaproteobacteria bacterium]